MKMKILFFAIIILGISECRFYENTVRFTKDQRWFYFTKFAYDIGTGKFKVKAKLLHSEHEVPLWSSYLQIQVYLDDDWDITLKKNTCEEKSIHRRSINYVFVKNNNEWGDLEIRDLSQYSRRRVWLFVVSDCDNMAGTLGESYFKISLEMLNSDGSHYSSEEVGMTTWHFIIICVLSLFLLFILRLYKTSKEINQEVDKPLVLILIAIIFELFANILEYYHMKELGIDGIGSPISNSIALILTVFCQFMLTTILLLIGWGWTIKFMDFKNNTVVLVCIVIFGIFNFTISGLSHLDDNSHHKYHDYEGFAGIVLSIIQIAIYFFFLIGSIETVKESRDQIKVFMFKFVILGTFYILSFPAILLIAKFIAPYVRHKFIVIGSIICQSLAMMLLTQLFVRKKGDYYEISYRSKSVLPDFKGE